MPGRDRLLDELAALGRSVPAPDPESVERAVMARIRTQPRPSWLARNRNRLAAAVLAALAALVVAPPVRAAIADWFGFGAVIVRHDDSSTPSGPAPQPPPVTGQIDLAIAANRAGFEVHTLAGLGPPAGIEWTAGRRILSQGWTSPTRLRLDQTSSLRFTFAKSARTVRFVEVNGDEALWFADPHEVVVLDPRGRRVELSTRPAGHTLVWTIGSTTLRLEGDLDLDEAIELAESAELVN